MTLNGIIYTFLFFTCIGPIVSKFTLNTDTDGNYQASFDGQTWFTSAPAFITVNNKRCYVDNGCMSFDERPGDTGTDKHGKWTSMSAVYAVGGKSAVQMVIKMYETKSMVIFEQHFLDGLDKTATINPNFVLSGFPSINIGSQENGVDLGYLNYGGMMVGDTTKWMDRWTNSTINLRDGVGGGPLALFDKTGRVIVISAFNEFMAASSQHEPLIGGTMSWGILGSVTSIPRGYVLKTILYYGEDGINRAFEGWGEVLRAEHNKQPSFAEVDFSVNYLGYWTDNGSYYYYNIPNDTTYDAVMLKVYQYAKEQNIPYRYIQYDSWWYQKGPFTGVVKWETQPGIFSEGMVGFYNATGWPVVGHNKWWSAFTPYAKQNGGQFDFLMDKLKSCPIDENFWDWLFKLSHRWGLVTYEQDWMTAQFLGMSDLLQNISLGRTWLNVMGKAAVKNGITLQYCMSTPRCALQSLEIPAVTQARVSDDYEPGQNNWKIGITDIFAHAIGLRPYKDTFWTISVEKGDVYDRVEPWPALHALASTLSTGPVGPGDGVGMTNRTLLMRCCNADGLILKPDVPIRAVDDQILEAAFHTGNGPQGEVYTTWSMVSGLYFGIIMAADMHNSYAITPTKAHFPNQTYIVYRDDPIFPGKDINVFSDSKPLLLKGCTNDFYCLYYVTPILRLGSEQLLLFGEISKWVPLSNKRITSISHSSQTLILDLQGGIGEEVEIWYQLGSTITSIKAELGMGGTGTIQIGNSL